MQKKYFLTLMLCFSALLALAQSKTITGRVYNQTKNTPLANVNILADKQKGGVTSKEDGTYSITVSKNATALVFSYVGFAPQTIIIGDNSVIDVQMQPSVSTEDEVVVIGYGTQKRSSVTGAVAKYKNDRLEETPSSRLDQALQGKIAGVQVQNVSSEAGAAAKVQVRGLSSVNADAAPLVVVDGHPVPDGLAFVNMADVESVEVLKDAASSAIYGSRGANGVILITTKSGKVNKTRYSLKTSTGIKQAYELYPMLTTTEYTNLLFYEASLKATDPSVPPLTASQIATDPERGAYIIEQYLRGGQSTDWQSQAIRTAATQNIQLSVSGGNNAVKYYISGGYQNDQGMMYHSEYKRFNLKNKLDIQLNKKLNITFNVNPSVITRERPSTNYIDFVRFQSYLPVYLNENTAAFVRNNTSFTDVRAGDFAQARYFNGIAYSGVMPDGSNYASSGPISPFNTSNNSPKSVLETRSITNRDYRSLVSIDGTYKISKSLSFKSLGSAYVLYSNSLDFAQRNSNRAGDLNKGVYGNRLFVDLLNENTFNFSKRFKDHTVDALAGFTAQKTVNENGQTTGYDYPSDNIRTLNTAVIIDQNTANTYTLKEREGLLSVLGRVNYGYKNKYFASATLRSDGSSKFAPGFKWGYFPSLSLGWNATKEKFLEDVNWLSNLKFRASYGETGNNRIANYGYIDLLYAANYPFGTGTGSINSGQAPDKNTLATKNITWETTYQYNGGVDVSFLKNTINISLDVYRSTTDKLLLNQAALAITGVPATLTNIGSLDNKGFEIELSTNQIRRRNFTWSTSANLSHNQNRVKSLGREAFLLNQGERTETYRNKVGNPLIEYFGYKTDGVWLSQKDIDEAKAKGLKSSLPNIFVPGGLKLVDVNGDNIIDASDRTALGNPYPDFIYGITNNFKYKSFDLMFLVQGVQGGTLVNGDINYNETRRYNKNYIKDRWISPAFPGDGKTPYSTLGFNPMLTDYVVEDASYYALREILVGYTLPQQFAAKAKLSSLRLYISAQNIYFHSNEDYRGINIESRFSAGPYSSPLISGYQRGSFPIPKTYLLGIDINF